MATSTNLPLFLERIPISIQLIALALVLGLAYSIYNTVQAERAHKNFPIVSLPEEGLSARESWRQQSSKCIEKGLREYKGRPFQVMSGTGPRIILPNHYAEELKNNANLHFMEAVAKDFFHTYPGFEAFKPDHIRGQADSSGFMAEVVRTKLTQSLGLVTDDLVDETNRAVGDIFGRETASSSDKWHAIPIKQNVLDLVARLSSRVFLGTPLCRDSRWLEIARDYTVDAFLAARELRTVNPLLRPIMHWFVEPCVRLRKDRDDARALIEPEIERRRVRARKALEAGQKPPKTADTIGWMVEVAGERSGGVDYVSSQLGLTLAAIHTTSEGISQVLIDIIANPHLIKPLREEVVQVVGSEGWSKTALYKLRLMDAVLRESQRMHPPSRVSMNRLVKSSFNLSTGETLPKDAVVTTVSATSNPATYPSPETFDPYRHIRAREATPNSNQHVSLSSSAMGFGYGQHACPGRFFASNEMKIALAYLLVGYDWRVVSAAADSSSGKGGMLEGDLEMARRGAEKLRAEIDTQLMVLPNAEVEIRVRGAAEREIELGGLMEE